MEKCGVFKYLKVCQCDGGSEFKLMRQVYLKVALVTLEEEQQNINKLTAFDAQELQDPEKV